MAHAPVSRLDDGATRFVEAGSLTFACQLHAAPNAPKPSTTVPTIRPARAIPGAVFELIPGMGHNIPGALAPRIAARVLDFLRSHDFC